MPFKFIHTADIHLDSPLKTLALRDPELAGLIGNATRQALTQIVTLCVEENVDALLIAGDLYDGNQTSMKTARFLAQQLRRLDAAGILTFIIRGNHDALSKITKELTLPDSVKIFTGRAETVIVERQSGAVPIAIHGMSFSKPRAPDSLLPKYPASLAAAINIALMHTSLAGSEGHDSYAPCKLSDLQSSGHQYWALGHIHKRSVSEVPGCVVVMPGIPQGRDINENGAKSVTLVTCQDDGQIQLEERLTSLAQFERVAVNIDGVENWRDVVAAVAAELQSTRETTESEHLVARVLIDGRTPLAWRLRRDVDLLKTELDDRATQIESTWIEKIELYCQTEAGRDSSQLTEDAPVGVATNPLIELADVITGKIIPSSGFEEEIAALAKNLRNHLPRECRDIFGSDETSSQRILEKLSREGADDVIAQLHSLGNES